MATQSRMDEQANPSPVDVAYMARGCAQGRDLSKVVKHTCWQQAMQDEFDAFHKNGTCEIVSCPPSVKPIGCKWVYNIKLKYDGSLDRYKKRDSSLWAITKSMVVGHVKLKGRDLKGRERNCRGSDVKLQREMEKC
ncbi:hypothetical protein EZV62_001259 [Acer yangbiense]|uniref:Reverse transcriptase Ty1/copia-type domain-containing protein n=1 Tax=Acer yangbiense TaxID=1000413 RepID=A0A5C7ITJ0_9ROSI|nr:hypothetical protein EZV62_001259 [Acer yangbiense]